MKVPQSQFLDIVDESLFVLTPGFRQQLEPASPLLALKIGLPKDTPTATVLLRISVVRAGTRGPGADVIATANRSTVLVLRAALRRRDDGA